MSSDDRNKSVPCDARVADGAIRGGLVGLLWAGFYGPGEFAALQTPSAVLPFALRYGALSTLAFATFFGAYSGMLCRTERLFGSDNLSGSIIAGGTMGAVVGACMPPRGTNALMIGGTTALISGATAALLQRKGR
jgi:hypothetical protein